MKENKTATEAILYWLAFLLALGIRLYQLGAAPLSEVEAGWALQALGLAHGGVVTLGPQPAYILLTSRLFYIFGDTNFLARFISAITGSLIIWLPYYFRGWMGDSRWLHRSGVVMAFGLAIDPGLVSLSRQAGSLMPAMTFTLLALACLYNRRMIWVGIFAGLALLSGPAFLQGMLILGVSWGLYRLVFRELVGSQPDGGVAEQPVGSIPASSIRVGGAAFILTLLFAGSLFLRVPQGLGALADTIPAYLNTWLTSSGIPILRLPASLLVYQLIVLIFGIIAAFRAWLGHWDDQHPRQALVGLSIWAGVAFFLPWLYAGRQVGDLAWAIIPLWALAAVEISRSLLGEEDNITRLIAAGLAMLLCVFAVIGWINLLSIGRYQEDVVIYGVIIIGAFVLGFIALLLVMAGWSLKAAKLGVVWSLCILLGLFLFSNTWGMSIVRQNGAQEMWNIPPTAGQVDQLITTLSDLSSWNTGLRDQLEVVVLEDSPTLKWALRNFPNARFETTLPSTESPPVVITLKGDEEPKLAEKYRGQDVVWRLYPGWQGAFPPDFINWLAFRQAPLDHDQIILWARTDVFPGGVSDSTGSAIP
jgi:hypothetical membrane protein